MSETSEPLSNPTPAEPLTVEVESIDLEPPLDVLALRSFKPLEVSVKPGGLLTTTPWVRSLGKLTLEVTTQGWRFPAPGEMLPPPRQDSEPAPAPAPPVAPQVGPPEKKTCTRLRPPTDMVQFKDRLLYLLQPPLESVFGGRQLELPFKPYPYQIKGVAFLMPRHAALIADEMGLGKAQPLDARVLTPTGWKRMGDIQVGDAVVNAQGGASRVIGVYPQGEKDIYRVEFSDGAATECCDDHLWLVNTPLRKGRVLPLRDLRQRLTAPAENRRYCIPLVQPVAFQEGQPLPVPPYQLGVLLADGTVRGPRQCELEERPETKRVPETYRWAAVESRLALLRGLMDTAGSVGPHGSVEFSTLSPDLANDVTFLVRSLGGTVRAHQHQRSQRLTIAMPGQLNPFALARKAAVWSPRREHLPTRTISAVTWVGRKPAQCLAVDSPDHLYVTDDFIVTHNTAQVILSLRLLFHSGMIQRALVVCPKPLVINWTRELRLWGADIPCEVIGGDTATRRHSWFVSKCPLKLVNYEILTRDADWVSDEQMHFDVVVLDEAQRIKNLESKTAQAARGIRRERSWAMSGTPIENRTEDLVSIFAFVDPERIPPNTPAKMLPQLTSDCILRRVKEEVAADMPPKVIRDAFLELTPGQRASYDLAEKEGVFHLNGLGQTISVQHVFELVMRLKQVCNFDPRTGESAKLEQLLADMAEVAESGRKAIIFSQWVQPLERLAQALADHRPLLYHGKVPHKDRQPILDQFRDDKNRRVLLMSYGTGSVGLNLQFCNYVFLFDRWWNPAVEDQAINRAHRLGQKDTVFVTRFISQHTIEGRIAEILEKKRQLFNDLIARNGPPPSLGLSEDEIFGLFEINARPKRAAA